MSEVLRFPPDVAAGAAFASADAAVAWMASAAAAGYPGVDPSWIDVASPLLIVEIPPLVMTDTLDIEQIRQAWTAYDNGDAGMPLDLPAWLPEHDPPIAFKAMFCAEHRRNLLGVADAMRRTLPAAKSRRDVAKVLGQIEQAEERAAAVTLSYCNAYAADLWRDAIVHGIATDPPSPYAKNPRKSNNGAGTPRLGRSEQ